MNVVVLGAGGLLGRHCVQAFAEYDVLGFTRKACDVAVYDEVREAVRGANLVINCAAYTNADKAETDHREVWAVNVVGAANIAMSCASERAILVHISTDSVFDGEHPIPYAESSLRNPISVYGRSKLEGEIQTKFRQGLESYVVRVQGLYGDGGNNFASRIVGLVKAGRPFYVDNERRTQPTWAKAAADQILTMVTKCSPGTYHVSCRGETTWAGFAKAVAAKLGLPECWEEVPTVALGLPAKRPKNCTFSHRALGDAYVMRDWCDTLEEYLEETHVARAVAS